MPEEDLVDIKFRLYDGSDIGPFRYSATSTVDMLKQRIVSDWPKGKTIVPKAVNEVKLISSGKILENDKTVGQCKAPFGDAAGGIIIMHVVVQPSLAKTKTEKKVNDSPRKIGQSEVSAFETPEELVSSTTCLDQKTITKIYCLYSSGEGTGNVYRSHACFCTRTHTSTHQILPRNRP
ncbi:hypothetical protein V6N13_029202 [Hibiscus sabdariffa]